MTEKILLSFRNDHITQRPLVTVFQKVSKNNMCSPRVNSWVAHNNLVLTSCHPLCSDFLLLKTSLIGAVDVTVLHIEYQVYRESISDKILIIVFSQKMINDMKWWLIVVKLNNMIFKEVTFDKFLKAHFKISWNLGTSYRTHNGKVGFCTDCEVENYNPSI